MKIFNENSALTQTLAMETKFQDLLTAKQWLDKFKRYPALAEIGIKLKGRKGLFFTYDQTLKVCSESAVHPYPDVKPIPLLRRGKRYYYHDQCEIKLTYHQWHKKGRQVRPNSVPCEVRKGFCHQTKQKINISYFLKSDTYTIEPNLIDSDTSAQEQYLKDFGTQGFRAGYLFKPTHTEIHYVKKGATGDMRRRYHQNFTLYTYEALVGFNLELIKVKIEEVVSKKKPSQYDYEWTPVVVDVATNTYFRYFDQQWDSVPNKVVRHWREK
ncbi:hypothetical protein [Vibrio sp. SCSIO 43137]|uniref:hypothetical protein n=1 Tax=Vibrio sp. SCSIO 43137 TaxID=3021011 RepID=UPI0023071B0C|nr:hypothetical protein [Vibrio sp. SCSIO 43137]WCE30062.1 hypothetical protein PK654_01810 [Vibrio sp. SCSIO 43137]